MSNIFYNNSFKKAFISKNTNVISFNKENNIINNNNNNNNINYTRHFPPANIE